MDKVVHFEVPAEDLERARKFYTGVFGWKIDRVPNMDYQIVSTVETDEKGMPKEPGAINGGMMMKHDDTPSPVIVINVAKMEDSLRNLKESGGRVVMEPQKVGDMGLYARFVDPEGNLMGIWQDLK
ncbi:MAG: VOC family protein [Candidatus Aenigmarchaeota archaeon]|nr:VOC family protein [Candidatus Aenigmarchaeota archaeon]